MRLAAKRPIPGVTCIRKAILPLFFGALFLFGARNSRRRRRQEKTTEKKQAAADQKADADKKPVAGDQKAQPPKENPLPT